jgi:hypothetical protein
MTPPPRAAGLRRSLALLLLAIFLGAGTTLPGADALLFHWHEPGTADHRDHIEPAGGCASHADSCTLGRSASGAGAELAHTALIRIEPPAGSSVEPNSGPPFLAAARGGLSQPRAPPVTVA